MTHELRLNKSAHTQESIDKVIAEHVELHQLQDIEMVEVDHDDEAIFHWDKPVVAHVCGVNG
jgi:hypothetical protein